MNDCTRTHARTSSLSSSTDADDCSASDTSDVVFSVCLEEAWVPADLDDIGLEWLANEGLDAMFT